MLFRCHVVSHGLTWPLSMADIPGTNLQIDGADLIMLVMSYVLHYYVSHCRTLCSLP